MNCVTATTLYEILYSDRPILPGKNKLIWPVLDPPADDRLKTCRFRPGPLRPNRFRHGTESGAAPVLQPEGDCCIRAAKPYFDVAV